MKELPTTRLGKIEAVHGRLEQAVARLELAVVAREESATSIFAAAIVEQNLRSELETVKAGHLRLEVVILSVVERLNSTIKRLRALLGE